MWNDELLCDHFPEIYVHVTDILLELNVILFYSNFIWRGTLEFNLQILLIMDVTDSTEICT